MPPETLKAFLASIGASADLEQLEAIDRRACGCPIPYTLRKYNPYLGRWTNIKLCCFVRALEKLTGQTFYESFEFDPIPWDAEEAPPPWLAKRMKEKNIDGYHQG